MFCSSLFSVPLIPPAAGAGYCQDALLFASVMLLYAMCFVYSQLVSIHCFRPPNHRKRSTMSCCRGACKREYSIHRSVKMISTYQPASGCRCKYLLYLLTATELAPFIPYGVFRTTKTSSRVLKHADWLQKLWVNRCLIFAQTFPLNVVQMYRVCPQVCGTSW